MSKRNDSPFLKHFNEMRNRCCVSSNILEQTNNLVPEILNIAQHTKINLYKCTPKKTIDKLQCVWNAATRVVSNRGQCDRGITQFWRQTLHWLDVADRIGFKLCIQVYKCQHSITPGYLAKLCKPVANIDDHRHLRSADRGQLDIPRVGLSTYGGHTFCYAGPSAWNALPDFLKSSRPYTFSVYF